MAVGKSCAWMKVKQIVSKLESSQLPVVERCHDPHPNKSTQDRPWAHMLLIAVTCCLRCPENLLVRDCCRLIQKLAYWLSQQWTHGSWVQDLTSIARVYLQTALGEIQLGTGDPSALQQRLSRHDVALCLQH